MPLCRRQKVTLNALGTTYADLDRTVQISMRTSYNSGSLLNADNIIRQPAYDVVDENVTYSP